MHVHYRKAISAFSNLPLLMKAIKKEEKSPAVNHEEVFDLLASMSEKYHEEKEEWKR
jgi:hypothetical protein